MLKKKINNNGSIFVLLAILLPILIIVTTKTIDLSKKSIFINAHKENIENIISKYQFLYNTGGVITIPESDKNYIGSLGLTYDVLSVNMIDSKSEKGFFISIKNKNDNKTYQYKSSFRESRQPQCERKKISASMAFCIDYHVLSKLHNINNGEMFRLGYNVLQSLMKHYSSSGSGQAYVSIYNDVTLRLPTRTYLHLLRSPEITYKTSPSAVMDKYFRNTSTSKSSTWDCIYDAYNRLASISSNREDTYNLNITFVYTEKEPNQISYIDETMTSMRKRYHNLGAFPSSDEEYIRNISQKEHFIVFLYLDSAWYDKKYEEITDSSKINFYTYLPRHKVVHADYLNEIQEWLKGSITGIYAGKDCNDGYWASQLISVSA